MIPGVELYRYIRKRLFFKVNSFVTGSFCWEKLLDGELDIGWSFRRKFQLEWG